MSEESHSVFEMLREDPRYKLEAYEFVGEALGYAQRQLGMGVEAISEEQSEEEALAARHLTGQQLCEAIRQYALEQFGYMAKVVLNSWGVYVTLDFGEIVYNLIRIGQMSKSPGDRLEDFEDVYDFDEAFQQDFEITLPE